MMAVNELNGIEARSPFARSLSDLSLSRNYLKGIPS